MIVGIFCFGVLVSAVTVIGILSIGVAEANDEAHGKADDAFTQAEREFSDSLQ